MNILKRLYLQYTALKGNFTLGTLIGLCEVYEYDLDESKNWQAEVAWNMKWSQKDGMTTNRELRRILSIFFINHTFMSDKAFEKVMANRRRVLPLVMACLKKRQQPLNMVESTVIAKLPQENFELLPRPLHPRIEKELLTSDEVQKVFWYCNRFELSTDSEMSLVLLATGNSYAATTSKNIDYKKLLLEYVKNNKEAFNNDYSFDLLCKQDGLNEIKEIVLSRRADV